MSFGGPEILIIAAVVLLLFGARKLPEFGKGLGRGIKEFRSETRDEFKPQQPQPSEPSGDITDVQATPVDSGDRRA